MPIRTAGFAALLAVVLLAASAVQADETDVYQKLIAQKAGPVVSVKFVLRIKISMAGQAGRERENNASAAGVVVDASGLVMLQAAAFNLRMGLPRGMMRQMDITAVPSNIRVIFPGDTREYPAVLGAKDSKLGLAFVLIKDLGEKKVLAADLETTVEPKVGQTLYGVTRLEQGFDYAPVCSRVKVSGAVTKPRTMWVVEDARDQVGMPLYDETGAVAGIVVRQEGVGEDAGTLPFLLPLTVAKPTIAGALKKAKEELERILDEEAEAEAKPEPADEGEKKDGDGEKKDGEEK